MPRRSQSTPIRRRERMQQEAATTPPLLALLEHRFAEFRAEHPRGTRIPGDLRAEALAALSRGVGASDLHRICGVSRIQLEAWQAGRDRVGAGSEPRETAPADVRVFSVVDSTPSAEPEPAARPDQVLELRLGPWCVCVRLADLAPRT